MFKTVRSLSLALSLVASVSGCAAIAKLKGGSSPPPTATASSSPSTPASAPHAASSGAPTQGAAFVSSQLSYTDVGRTDNAHIVFRTMKAQNSHPLAGGNPDPAWIPAWDKLTSDDAAEVAIAQAAVNRTYAAAVNAAFTKWWTTFGPVADAQRTEIARVTASKDSHYAKLAALRALWTATAKSAAVADPYGNYLLQFQIASAAAVVLHAADADFMTYRFVVAIGADTGLATRGHVPGTEAEERQQFTFAAMKGELHPLLPSLPLMDDVGNGNQVVKYPLATADEKRVSALRVAAAESGTAMMTAPADVPSFDTKAAPGIVVYLSSEGQDDVANGLTTKRVTAIGKNTITVAGKLKNSVPYGCKTGIGVDAGGAAQVQQDCNYKSDDTKITITLEVDEVPPIKLQVGDTIDGRGTVKEYKSTKGAINARLENVYIERVRRDGKTLFGNG